MAVTATTVAAATTMLAAVAAVFLTLVLCFYIFLCAKRYRGGAPAGRGVRAWIRFLLWGNGNSGGGGAGAASDAAWCYEGGLDDKSMAKLPCREINKGEDPLDCAVCITELAAGETARVLPRCGHAFHVACVDTWLKSHSTCPLCRCPAVDEPPKAPAPPAVEADPDSPNFPTNVLFFGSQDEVSTGRAAHRQQAQPASDTTAVAASQSQSRQQEEEEEPAARVVGMRRLLIVGCGGASPPPAAQRDIEMGLADGESLGR